VVKALLEKGAMPRGRNNSRGETALHCAVLSGDEGCVRALLEADPLVVNEGVASFRRICEVGPNMYSLALQPTFLDRRPFTSP